ncbi:hypothetical protein, partial [Halalkalibacter alkalisediminis]|uniref:hypothetical protein n=1 Tax=Halalkalibacter alkalisediminis TaxID=935616 RepID=UPI002360ECE1
AVAPLVARLFEKTAQNGLKDGNGSARTSRNSKKGKGQTLGLLFTLISCDAICGGSGSTRCAPF